MANDKTYRKLHAKLRPIIAWDGEGITVGDDHKYIMLCNSVGGSIEDIEGLDTKRIFDFLLDSVSTKDTLHIGFGFNYDVSMFLKSLSGMVAVPCGNGKIETGKTIISYIQHNKTKRGVRFCLGGVWYEVHNRPRKQFILSRFRPGPKWERKGTGYVKNADSITIWDVWGFSQGTFVSALQEYNIPADLEAMQAMKLQRGVFIAEQFDEIKAYCVSECVALSSLYRQQLCDFFEADLMPSRHDGPGAIAATLMKRESVKDFLEMEPEDMREPVACAYFGGRIEMVRIGVMGEMFGYDIASAYPTQIATLPPLGGKWQNVNSETASVRLFRVRYKFDRGLPFYPFPFRTPSKGVLFSAEGESWVWDREERAAHAWCERFGQSFEIVDAWSYFAPQGKPFAFVPDIYEQRQQWKKEGKGAQKALKLALNSLYGKTAQQLGGTLEKPPPFFSLVWAGLITAGTRAELLLAALQAKDPENIVCFMTDGLYSLERLPIRVWNRANSQWPKLGEWEGPDTYEDGVFVQAGVYWLKAKGQWKARYRGFDREAMAVPSIALEAWQAGRLSVEVDVTRFASYGAALMSKDLWTKRGTWVSTKRNLRLDGDGVKREGTAKVLEGGSHVLRVKLNVWGEMGHTSYPYDAITLANNVADTTLLDEDVSDYRD
jgi:hypothetical protein